MKLYRYADKSGKVGFATNGENGMLCRIDGGMGNFKITKEIAEVARFLPPIDPTQIFAIGHNYKKHIEETNATVPNKPVVFMKAINSVNAHEQAIMLPRFLESTKVDYECELAVIIGKTAKNLTPEKALDCVLGYTCANDVSAREWQGKTLGGGQFCRAKSFDTFCPLGPCLVTKDEIPNPQNLKISTVLNGNVMQEANTSDMLFSVAEIIAFLSGSTTIPAGTIILTGTPSGVGVARDPKLYLKSEDVVTVTIDKIGSLTNPVTEEKI